MTRHGLRGGLLATSSLLALVIGLHGSAEAAACHYNNVAGGVDNTTAQDCVVYQGGGAFTANVTNEATGSLTTTAPEGGPLPGTASGIGVLTPGTTLTGNIVNKGTITTNFVNINIGTGNFGTPPTSPGAGATLNGSITNSGSLLVGVGSSGTTGISLSGTGSVVTGSINNDINGTIAGEVGIGVTNNAHLGGSLINDGKLNLSLGHGFEINTGATIAGNVTNSATGTITTTGSAGMSIAGSAAITGTVTNGGTINSTRYGILLAPSSVGGSVINSGVMNSGGYGIVLFGSSNVLTSSVTGNVSNTGTINANGRDGIAVFAFSNVGGAVSNTNKITAARNGILVVNTTTTAGAANVTGGISNSGTLTSNGTGFAGIALVGGTVSNGIANTSTGVINSATGVGILVSNQTPIRLSGFASTVTGGIVNQGSITAKTGIVIGGLSTVAGGITNSGNITGTGGTAIDLATVNSGEGAATTINQQGGTITGNILLSAFADTVNISGGAIAGNIVGQGTSNTVNFALGAGTFSYSNTISGVNAVNVNSGTLMLGGTIGPTHLAIGAAGTLIIETNGSLSSNNVTDNGILAVNRSDTFTFGSVISGSGAFQQTGSGTTILTGTNNYTGGTTISAGTLQIGNGGTTGSIVGNVLDNGVFAINHSDAVTFGGVISGGGAFQQMGSGTTTLTGTNTYAGGTTIAAGTLQIGNGGTTGSIVGNVLDNGVLIVNLSSALTLSGAISGNGAVQQIGTGTTILTGTNTYTGGTTIAAGTLQIGNGGGTGSIVGNVLNNGVLAVDLSSTLTLNGVISGSGAFQQTGTGTTVLAGANTYNGGTTISAGTLQLGNGGTTGSIVGNVLDNGAFAINHSDAFAFGNVISGSGAFLQIGTGTTTLTGANTYTGPTIVAAGTLAISATGSITSNVTNNATFNNAGTVTGSLTNNGTATNSGTITNGLINAAAAGTATNTGTINGGVIVGGGTLNTNAATSVVNGGLGNLATVNAAGAVNGAITNMGLFNVTGTLASDSTFANAVTGTLAVGAATYTLQGLLTNSGVVTVASGGQLIDTVGGITNTATGTVTVAKGGTVKDDLNNAGAVSNAGAYFANVATNTGAGNIINAATGSWSGNVLSNAAAITNNGVWTGNVVSNTGTITNNLTWTGTVTNAGTFNNNAGATVSGLLTNTAGTTNNAGALNGGANVTGGALTGSGSVSNLTMSGGIFAPGNGTPGTSMTVTGNLAFQTGVQYLVLLNSTTSSFASVTGTATLGGATVSAMYAAGTYVSKQYTILSATGGVSGAFGSLVNTNLPTNFTTSLSYDATHAFLNLTLNFTPPPPPPPPGPTPPSFPGGLNVNQQNVANALVNFFNSTGSIPLAFGALNAAGLTVASGELPTASQQTTFDAMGLFMGLLTDPFVAGRGDPVTPTNPAPQYADEDSANAYAANGKPRSKGERDAYAAIYRKAPLAAPFVPSWSVWAAGYGGSQTTDGNAVLGSNTATSSIFGTAVGADYRFSPSTIAGFALAGGGTNFSIANALGTGRSDLFQAGAYVRHTAGPAYISGALAYGWQDITTNRTVTLAGVDQLRAEFNANTFSGRVEGGYRFVTPWMGVTPYAAAQSTTFDLPAYAEQAIVGGNMFALAYGAKDVTDTRSELGIRTDKSFAMTNSILTLRGRFAWAHDYDPDRNIGATFQTLPGASFVVNGAAQARDSALTTASAEVKWMNGWSAAATFEGEFSQVTNSYAGKGVIRYTW